MPKQTRSAGFVEPMLLMPTTGLPEGPDWTYELKLDGYRAIGFKSNGRVQLRSRNNKDFVKKYSVIAQALIALPEETVIDGEIVALDESGRPSFNSLQNYDRDTPILYYVFDLLMIAGRDITGEPLARRRELLKSRILARLKGPVREWPGLEACLSDVIAAVRAQGLEGVVAKNLKSVYEPGRRSGAWQKMRINKEKDFLIGGYTVSSTGFDAVIFGEYEVGKLLYVGRTRNGFTPAFRRRLYGRFRPLEIADCPFANLPEARSGRWGLGLTREKMKDCHWLKPELIGQFEFVEWTPDRHLRHSRFVRLRENGKNPSK